MLLSDIVDELFVRSGQFILGKLDSVDLNMKEIWRTFEQEVNNYERFAPLNKRFNIQINGYFMHDFTADINNVGYTLDNPTTVSQTLSLAIASSQHFTVTFTNKNLQPSSVVVKYNGATVATDNGGGTLVFTDTINHTGTIDYVTGKVTLNFANVGSTSSLPVVITALYVNQGSPPEMITKIVPVGTMQIISVLAYWMSPMTRSMYSPDRLIEPRMLLPVYEKPKLYYSEVGPYDITAQYRYQKILVYGDSNDTDRLTDVNIVGIEDNDNYYVLLQILLGRWLQIIGRSRRAFTYVDLPITTDARDLVDEGTKIYDDSMKLLTERHDWWLGLHT